MPATPAYVEVFELLCKGEILFKPYEGATIYINSAEPRDSVNHKTVASLTTKCDVKVQPVTGGLLIAAKETSLEGWVVRMNLEGRTALGVAAARQTMCLAVDALFADPKSEQAKLDLAFLAETPVKDWIGAFTTWDNSKEGWMAEVPENLAEAMDWLEQVGGGAS